MANATDLEQPDDAAKGTATEQKPGSQYTGAPSRMVRARGLIIAAIVALAALALVAGLPAGLTVIAALVLGAVALVIPLGDQNASHLALADDKVAQKVDAATLPSVPTADADATVQSILLAVPAPVALIDGQAGIIAANDAFVQLFEPGTVSTSALIRFRNPDVQNAILAAVEGRRTAVAEFADKGRLGRWFELTAVPLEIGTVSQARGLLHFRDLSEARRLEKMRTDFVGNASHELRTPLASLKGYLETLAGAARNDPEARERFIGIMLEQADRMERLIDDLLSLSRFETGLGRSSFGPTDLSDTLFHVRSALTPMAEKYGAELEFDDESLIAAPHRVNGSRDELIQLFENLVENAIKYGDTGTKVQVGITSTREFERDVYKVTVSDNGPGIASEHIPRLTERFYRIDVQTSRERQGTGLGLAIVKHILTRHDGYLSVKSDVGTGSTFTVTIPRSGRA